MEFFDIVDQAGEPTGEIVERSAAHAGGIRHRTSHVWLVRRHGGRLQVLLQKRSHDKDSFPDRWDISSAGHIPAGDTWIPSALRELKEELGIDASPEQLIYVLCYPKHCAREMYGRMFRDNQVSSVFVMVCDLPEAGFTPQPEEVSEVRWFDLASVLEEVRAGTIENCIVLWELETLFRFVSDPENGVFPALPQP